MPRVPTTSPTLPVPGDRQLPQLPGAEQANLPPPLLLSLALAFLFVAFVLAVLGLPIGVIWPFLVPPGSLLLPRPGRDALIRWFRRR